MHPVSLRASARLKAKSGVGSLNSNFGPASGSGDPGSRRRQNGSKQPKWQVRGKLKLMTEMPVDILFETFSHLQPPDILNLSKASKSLRTLLLSQQAISIWKYAFLNLDVAVPKPPNVPSDMNIVQYTGLLYGHHCYYCASIKALFVNWAACKRICGSCLKTQTIIPKHDDELHTIACKIIPPWRVQRSDRWALYLKDDFENVVQNLSKMEKHTDVFNLFVKERIELRSKRSIHATLCEQWQAAVDLQHRKELEEIRWRRRDAVKEKLAESGWRDELRFLSDYEIARLPGVDQAKELTDRAWYNIQAKIFAQLEQLKATRLTEERRKVLRSRMLLLRNFVAEYGTTQARNKLLPNAADVATLEPFHSLVFKSPVDTILQESNFADLRPKLGELCDEWIKSSNKLLLRLLPQSFTTNDLDLATTFFRCQWCREPISYPRILKHGCLTRNQSGVENDELLHACSYYRPWNYDGKQVTFDEESHACAKEIISVCGQDPHSITMSEMDDLDYRVECLLCARTSRGRLVMRWKTAILHDVTKKHYGEEFVGVPWALLGPDDTIQAKDKEKGSWSTTLVGCAHCGVERTRNDMKEHLLKFHSMKCKRLDKPDIYIPLDTPISQPPYPVRIAAITP